jgi:hypothetical protein
MLNIRLSFGKYPLYHQLYNIRKKNATGFPFRGLNRKELKKIKMLKYRDGGS